MHYRCQQFRGTIKTRHNAALGRLKKLQRSDAPMHIKAQIARASCIGKAMFGAETFALGERFFSTLRTGIAHALLGSKRNIQPYIACMCLSRFLIDPELFVIQNAIRKARSYLVYASPEDAEAFYTAFVVSRCPAAQITGPAAALKWYIAKLGWTMTREGMIHIGSFLQLHICESNLEDILSASEDSWMEHVADLMHTRNLCRNIPPIDHILTRNIFENLPDKTKVAVGMQVVGGYMTNHQKQHFAPEQSEQCTYCGQLDSVYHRILECPATAVVRQQYPEVTEFLEEHDPIHQVFPLCYRDPAFEFHRTLQYQLPQPELDLSLLTPTSVVFTDGSCRHPADKRYRRASFAAVTPAGHSYNTLFIAHCHGRQTIPRAELQAVVTIEINTTVASIVTDSAYVLSTQEKLQKISDIRDLHEEKNFDLLKQWWQVMQSQQTPTPIIKVKAHENLNAETSELTFLRKGNSVADEVAKMTSSTLLPEFLSSWDKMYNDSRLMAKMLVQQYNMRFEMSMVRVQLDSQQSTKPSSTTCDFQWFSDYTVDVPQVFQPSEEAIHHIHASNWGTTFSGLALDWLATLQWPQTQPSKTVAVGITWFELAVNFQVATQQSIPVNVQLANGTKEHRWQFEDPTLDTSQFAYSDLIFSLQGCVKHLQWLLQTNLLPQEKTQKVRSLYLLGGNAFRMGFASRPQMRKQKETMTVVQKYLNQHNSGRLTFQQHPVIPKEDALLELRFFPLPEDTQAKRATRYNLRKKDIRLKRA